MGELGLEPVNEVVAVDGLVETVLLRPEIGCERAESNGLGAQLELESLPLECDVTERNARQAHGSPVVEQLPKREATVAELPAQVPLDQASRDIFLRAIGPIGVADETRLDGSPACGHDRAERRPDPKVQIGILGAWPAQVERIPALLRVCFTSAASLEPPPR